MAEVLRSSGPEDRRSGFFVRRSFFLPLFILLIQSYPGNCIIVEDRHRPRSVASVKVTMRRDMRQLRRLRDDHPEAAYVVESPLVVVRLRQNNVDNFLVRATLLSRRRVWQMALMAQFARCTACEHQWSNSLKYPRARYLGRLGSDHVVHAVVVLTLLNG